MGDSVSNTTRLQENRGTSACQEVPAASIYQRGLRGSQFRSRNVAFLLIASQFLCSFQGKYFYFLPGDVDDSYYR